MYYYVTNYATGVRSTEMNLFWFTEFFTNLFQIRLTRLCCAFYRWRIGDWTDCSKTCGGGYQMRSVVCVQQVETTIQEVRPHDHCPGQRPRTRLPCNKDKCPPHWATDGWSDVSY